MPSLARCLSVPRVLLSLGLACAQPAPAGPAPSFDVFLAGFRQALAQPGGDAIAAHTAWPILFEGRALGRAAFVQQAVPALFTPAQRRCLQRAPALAEGAQRLLSCPPYGYLFSRGHDGWRLTEFFVDAE